MNIFSEVIIYYSRLFFIVPIFLANCFRKVVYTFSSLVAHRLKTKLIVQVPVYWRSIASSTTSTSSSSSNGNLVTDDLFICEVFPFFVHKSLSASTNKHASSSIVVPLGVVSKYHFRGRLTLVESDHLSHELLVPDWWHACFHEEIHYRLGRYVIPGIIQHNHVVDHGCAWDIKPRLHCTKHFKHHW